MQITIFKKGLDKGEKVMIKSRDQFMYYVTEYVWSPSLFEEDKRQNKNFIETEFMVLDIDDSLGLRDAIAQVKFLGYTCIIGLSRNHMKEKNGVINDRFRF